MKLWSRLQRASLHAQLGLLLIVATAPLVLVLGTFSIWRQTTLLRGSFIAKNIELARLVGYNMAPGIEFNDHPALNEVLCSLTRTGEVNYAAVMNAQKTVLAEFKREEFSPELWLDQTDVTISTDRQVFSKVWLGSMHVHHKITFLDCHIGDMYLGFSLRRPNEEAILNLALFLFVLLLTSVALFFGARRFSNLIIEPISQLKSAAEQIANKQYSIAPLDLQGTQEIEFFGNTFSAMLKAIHDHQRELRELNQTLEQKVQERTAELAVQTRKAQESERRKGEFLTNMSHELRTPLTSILAWPDIILNFYERRAEVMLGAQQIKKTAKHLLQLIDDLIDMEAIDTGRIKIEYVRCNLRELLQEALQHLEGFARSRNVIVALHCPPQQDMHAMVDAIRFKQVIINLLSNAIKFSPDSGKVDITVTSENSMIAIQVKDQGKGIAAEEIPTLFGRFQQVDGSIRRRFGGSGIGLYLAKILTEMLSGSLSVTSEPGDGCVFTIHLPLAEP